MINLIRTYAPTLYAFLKGFFSATDNKPGGQSLRKWLSIGFFWLMCTLCVEFTDKDNLISVITVISSLITALIITNTAGNYYEKKLDKPKDGTNIPAGSEATG
jgi:hypothetical protein